MNNPIRLIVGLCNPGSEYEGTRHNAGADFVDELLRQYGGQFSAESKFYGEAARISINGKDVRLLKPTTFMNRSGQSVSALAKFFKIAPEEILVAHDELDMDPGVARLKIGGGHGGHNGLRDIIKALGNNNNFARLRLGIGHPGNAREVANYVLKRPSGSDRQAIDDAIYDASKVLPQAAQGQWNEAMKELHSKK
ncbi:aminoacyl-tRNA hydrolase [Pseudoteredinibacter isoporae]|uniref:Peptidyl-tRNA hydrolase n=1 Tax=Pseudoteredinibacter isoporae TaxID=570281 RepID=A0A7X0JR75_9GAMM|nr:aminoacyl-tRNA hydrolase [Pseudoteredinibacter isoporae]MBB6520794.1 PTH1 family peptidyl-tRNA hydrolase [Pseudoteredinibacter isoporae]NHO86360.1 aminoacyl-tRNA hydrolase [Pseudoteredinibacter isoporae]NIB25188.1 aminoacyl-tRNA hydrolase [Pseudoteredinibacter isoporae]